MSHLTPWCLATELSVPIVVVKLGLSMHPISPYRVAIYLRQVLYVINEIHTPDRYGQ